MACPSRHRLPQRADRTGAPVTHIRPAYGLLWLQIDPDDVSISLDGAYLDKDVWLISVPPGNHEIRVTKAGYRPRHSRFGISAGQNVRLDLTLTPVSDPSPGDAGP